MRAIHEMQIIFNIANMRKAITGAAMDLDKLHLYDVYDMNYDELYELQNSLVPHYNDSITNNN